MSLAFTVNSATDAFVAVNGNNPVQLISPLNHIKYIPSNQELKWAERPGTKAYNVYLDTENPPEFYKSVSGTTLQVSTLKSNTKYFWFVEAIGTGDSVQSPVRDFTTNNPTYTKSTGQTKLTFSRERNFYTSPFQLSITTNNPGSSIIYTTNCSTPSLENGLVYKGNIQIDSTTIVKARAYSASDTSELFVHSYLFADYVAKQPKNPKGFPIEWGGSSTIAADYEMDPFIVNQTDYKSEIAEAFTSVPSLSLSMDVNDWFNPSTGLYVGYPNSDETREKKVSAEFLFNNNQRNLLVECGVQNQGGTSIVNWKVPKQSMRLLFKEIYGPGKLDYKLFPDSEINSINTLVIDGFLYSWIHPWDNTQRMTSLYFRDQLASDMQNKMGWPSFHGIYVNLFINGLYWGMYDLHERPDEAFLSEYLDAAREDFDIIKHDSGQVVQGSNTDYIKLLNLSRKDLSIESNFKAVQQYLDIDAFIDYMILNFYLGNFDWAHQNYYAARNHIEQTGFRFYTWDAEHVMRYSDVNYDNTLKNDKGGPTEIHTHLKANPEYRILFADAVYRHMFNDGVLTPENFEKSFLYRKNEIDKIIILESARWGDYLESSTGVTYTKNGYWLPEVKKDLEQYIPKRRDIVITQFKRDDNKLFPKVMPPLIVEDIGSSGIQKSFQLTSTNTTSGQIYFTIDGSDPRMTGGTANGSIYSAAFKVTQSTIIKARFRADDGTWSALAQKNVLFDDNYGQGIVINEIMYHPENDYPEFIELMNSGESAVNLKGFSFSKGIGFTFTSDQVVQPGTGIVLSNNTKLFKEKYTYNASGQYLKHLSNEGETLLLENCFGQLIDSVTYADTIPWPVIDGDGYSIELTDVHLDNALASSWKNSEGKNGTPYNSEQKSDFNVNLFPNPFTSFIGLKIDNQSLANVLFTIGIYNQWGSKIQTLTALNYNSEIRIPMEVLPPGLYIIRIEPKERLQFNSVVLKAVKLYQ